MVTLVTYQMHDRLVPVNWLLAVSREICKMSTRSPSMLPQEHIPKLQHSQVSEEVKPYPFLT